MGYAIILVRIYMKYIIMTLLWIFIMPIISVVHTVCHKD